MTSLGSTRKIPSAGNDELQGWERIGLVGPFVGQTGSMFEVEGLFESVMKPFFAFGFSFAAGVPSKLFYHMHDLGRVLFDALHVKLNDVNDITLEFASLPRFELL